MPPSPTDIPSVITIENADRLISLVMFPREKKTNLSRVAVCKTVGGWFFLFLTESAMEWGIINGLIPSVGLSVIILPTDGMPYTDGINP
jgi:hypothetical protein